jgi:hypothetical protein
MSVLQEISAWAKDLHAWQSDALSRLLTKQTLTDADHEDLYALLKADHGIPDPQNQKPKSLSPNQVPAPVKVNVQVQLHAIKNLSHVNVSMSTLFDGLGIKLFDGLPAADSGVL